MSNNVPPDALMLVQVADRLDVLIDLQRQMLQLVEENGQEFFAGLNQFAEHVTRINGGTDEH